MAWEQLTPELQAGGGRCRRFRSRDRFRFLGLLDLVVHAELQDAAVAEPILEAINAGVQTHSNVADRWST